MNKDRILAVTGAAIGVAGLSCGAIYYAISNSQGNKISSIEATLNALNNPKPTDIFTPTAIIVSTLAQAQSQYEGNNNWDAENSLTKGINKAGFLDWYAGLQTLKNSGAIKKGNVRTFDAVDDLLKDGNGIVYAKDNGEF